MPPDTVIPLDRAHYDAIISTATTVGHLDEKVDVLTTDVRELKERFGDCPCPAVIDLQKRTGQIEQEIAALKKTIAIVAGAATLVANAIVQIAIAWGGK